MSDIMGVALMFSFMVAFMIFVLVLTRHEKPSEYKRGYQDAINKMRQRSENPNDEN